MIRLTVIINSDNIIGVKESLAEYLEDYGDITFEKIEQASFDQMKVEGWKI